jgi:hypothetical protein
MLKKNQKCKIVFSIFFIHKFALLFASTMAGWAVGRVVVAISITPLVVHTAQTLANLFCWCCAGTSIANTMWCWAERGIVIAITITPGYHSWGGTINICGAAAAWSRTTVSRSWYCGGCGSSLGRRSCICCCWLRIRLFGGRLRLGWCLLFHPRNGSLVW